MTANSGPDFEANNGKFYDGLPFSNFTEMVQQANAKLIDFTFDRAEAYNVSMLINRNTFIIFYVGFLLSLISLLIASFALNNFFILIFAPVLYFLYFKIDRLKILVGISLIAGLFLLIVGKMLFLSGILLSIVVSFIGYYIWWGYVGFLIVSTMLKSENLFLALFTSRKMLIKDSKGHFYRCNYEVEDDEYDKLCQGFINSVTG